jgi:SAM-dependent methyltransferase
MGQHSISTVTESQGDAAMRASYEDYFASDTYDSRYPRPNPNTLAFVRRALAASERQCVVDVGAGNGRYALPLLSEPGVEVWAVERSVEARDQIVARAACTPNGAALTVLEDLAEVPVDRLSASVVLFLFGVLAHMTPAERADVLSYLHSAASQDTILIGSVPNLRRRFRTEQNAATYEPCGLPRITYRRQLSGITAEFTYTLFSGNLLRQEMARHGWDVTALKAESLLPESSIARSSYMHLVDRALGRTVPADWGYGLLFAAHPVL